MHTLGSQSAPHRVSEMTRAKSVFFFFGLQVKYRSDNLNCLMLNASVFWVVTLMLKVNNSVRTNLNVAVFFSHETA